MKPWFRVYNDILTDEKLLSLSLDNQAIFTKFLAVSNLVNSGGTLPKLEVISKMIGLRIDKVRSAAKAMLDVGLIREIPGTETLAISAWRKRQYESDDVNARSTRHRESRCNVATPRKKTVVGNVARVHATDTETDTETEREKKSPPTPRGEEGRGRGDSTTKVVGPDGPVEVPSACSDADKARLKKLAAAYFDPLCLTDLIGRFVGVWGMTFEPDWIEALFAELAGHAAGGKRISEPFGTSILQRWAREGGIPEHRRKCPVAGSPSDSGESVIPISRASPAASQRPLTDHQRKQAALREFAFGPLGEEGTDGHRGGVGFQGDGEARGVAGLAGGA